MANVGQVALIGRPGSDDTRLRRYAPAIQAPQRMPDEAECHRRDEENSANAEHQGSSDPIDACQRSVDEVEARHES